MKKLLTKILSDNAKEEPSIIAGKLMEVFEIRKKDTPGDQRFDQFWAEYPRKTVKKEALKSWNRIKMTDELFAKIMSTLAAYKKSPQWIKDGGQFIPHPTTWLNQERWNDELKVEVNKNNSRFDNL